MKKKYDFGGWATKYDVTCSDGRIISHDAFKHQDKTQVPLVWNHNYSGPESVIGKATLKHADEGVYAYCEFNNSPTAETAKNLVVHGDIVSLSIFANRLKQSDNVVKHGVIRELSLVLAGANPGASIQEVLAHGGDAESGATIYNDEEELILLHGEELDIEGVDESDELSHAEDDTVKLADVYNSMTEEQKAAVAIIVDQLINNEYNNEEDSNMKHNVFDQGSTKEVDELKHSEFLQATISDIRKHGGSLKQSFLAHANTYGIKQIDTLFPEAKNIQNEPEFIKRDNSWVAPFFNKIKKSPFSRLKSLYADITADEARALGYTKGGLKKDEVISLLKRTTSPTTIYKKQKLDRDDIIDITSFDVVAWLKREMRTMLDEEIARAVLIGDGRLVSNPDRIKPECVRPIYNDEDLFTIKAEVNVTVGSTLAADFIKAVIRNMASYEGSGVPNLYVHPDMLADMLLLEDKNGRFIYPDAGVLAKTLRVGEIIPVPVMKGLERTDSKTKKHDVYGIIVNPADYTVGADKGGAVSMFDDFDIDYNQQKYLIETRCSGSLLKPKTAITLEGPAKSLTTNQNGA